MQAVKQTCGPRRMLSSFRCHQGREQPPLNELLRSVQVNKLAELQPLSWWWWVLCVSVLQSETFEYAFRWCRRPLAYSAQWRDVLSCFQDLVNCVVLSILSGVCTGKLVPGKDKQKVHLIRTGCLSTWKRSVGWIQKHHLSGDWGDVEGYQLNVVWIAGWMHMQQYISEGYLFICWAAVPVRNKFILLLYSRVVLFISCDKGQEGLRRVVCTFLFKLLKALHIHTSGFNYFWLIEHLVLCMRRLIDLFHSNVFGMK